MVAARKVLHDGLLGRSCMMVSVRKVLRDGIC